MTNPPRENFTNKIYTDIRAYTFTYIRLPRNTHMHLHKYYHTYAHIRVHRNRCTYTQIHIYRNIHTCTHMQRRPQL